MYAKTKLTETEFLELVRETSRKQHLGFIPEKKLIEAYRTNDTVIDCSMNGMIWANPYYVAYAYPDEDIHYVYISEMHIFDERFSYIKASMLRLKRIKLPEDTERAFRKASCYMKYNHTGIWVEPGYGLAQEENDDVAEKASEQKAAG